MLSNDKGKIVMSMLSNLCMKSESELLHSSLEGLIENDLVVCVLTLSGYRRAVGPVDGGSGTEVSGSGLTGTACLGGSSPAGIVLAALCWEPDLELAQSQNHLHLQIQSNSTME